MSICDWICENWSKLQKNWNLFYCWTSNLYSCTTQKHQTHSYRWLSLLSHMAFCCPCQTTKVHYRAFGASAWMVLIKIWVVPDCCQRLSRLILCIESVSVTKWRHSTTLCVLMEGVTRLRLPTFPHHPPHLTHPYNVQSVVLQSLWESCSKSSSVS